MRGSSRARPRLAEAARLTERASGARIALTAARQLQRIGGKYALVSLCIGGGQGLAVVLERV